MLFFLQNCHNNKKESFPHAVFQFFRQIKKWKERVPEPIDTRSFTQIYLKGVK